MSAPVPPGSMKAASVSSTRPERPPPGDAAANSAAVRAEFEALRERYLPDIMALIREVLAEVSPDGSSLAEMCCYHLETGGKRLRAMLPLLVGEAVGADPAQLVPFGAACEMLHNATLVHDDLQDGDRLRRGRATVWHRYGAAQAINLGDAMFYYTLLLVHRLELPIDRREAIARRVLDETLRVIEGQEREFRLRQFSRPPLPDYFAMVEAKTSGLFALPMAGAAALCGRPAEVVRGLQEAAGHMGVLFQLQDDVLDLYGEKGRDARGSDIREGKRSGLAIYALQCGSSAQASRLTSILDRERDATTSEEVEEAISILERTGALAFVLGELMRRREIALRVPALSGEGALLRLIDGMCDIFLEPIRGVLS